MNLKGSSHGLSGDTTSILAFEEESEENHEKSLSGESMIRYELRHLARLLICQLNVTLLSVSPSVFSL
jgi:hypothetical protein